jgi:preprotein translocase subunit YajC
VATLIFIVVMIAIVYLLLIRPQQRRKQQLQALHSQLRPGDEVLTAAGIYGTIESIDDEVIDVRVAPDVTMRMARRAIMSVESAEDGGELVTAPEPETAPEPAEAPDPVDRPHG